MHRTWPLVLVLLAVGSSGLALDTPACRKALDVLDAREAAAARERSPATRALLEAARKQAALACLRGADAPASAPLRSPSQASVVAVPSAAASAASTAAARMPIAVPAPAPVARPAPPVTLGACDATGCWTSDGTRLQRAGPGMLLGPRGICTVSGAVVQCP